MGDGCPDAERMLDRFIHEYLMRKNLHTTAQTFVREAGFQPFKDPNASPHDGRFLIEWWSIFYDVYCSRCPDPFQEEQASTSQPPLNVVPLMQNATHQGQQARISRLPLNFMPWPQNAPHQGEQASTLQPPLNVVPLLQNAQPGSSSQDPDCMIEKLWPSVPRPGLPNLIGTVNPTPMPNMGNFLRMIPCEKTVKNTEQSVDADSNVMSPARAHRASRLQRMRLRNRQLPVINEVSQETGLRSSTPSEIAPNSSQLTLIEDYINIAHEDAD